MNWSGPVQTGVSKSKTKTALVLNQFYKIGTGTGLNTLV